MTFHLTVGLERAPRGIFIINHPRATRDCTVSPIERERERERERASIFRARAALSFAIKRRSEAASTWPALSPGCRVVFRTRRRSDPDFPLLGERETRRMPSPSIPPAKLVAPTNSQVCALQTRRVKRFSGSRRVALSATRKKVTADGSCAR